MDTRYPILLELCKLLVQEGELKGVKLHSIGITSFAPTEAAAAYLAGAGLGMAMRMANEPRVVKPFAEIMDELGDDRKKRLVGSISGFFTGKQIDSAEAGMALLSQEASLKSAVLRRIIDHFRLELRYDLIE